MTRFPAPRGGFYFVVFQPESKYMMSFWRSRYLSKSLLIIIDGPICRCDEMACRSEALDEVNSNNMALSEGFAPGPQRGGSKMRRGRESDTRDWFISLTVAIPSGLGHRGQQPNVAEGDMKWEANRRQGEETLQEARQCEERHRWVTTR